MANALDMARQALEAARGKIGDWDRAIETARTEQAKAEQATPSDPAELDQYADTYSRAAGKIRAAEQGRKVAASAEVTALEEVVRAGLEDAKVDQRTAQKAHDDHRRKLDALLAKVAEFDGAHYRPFTIDDLDTDPAPEQVRKVKASKAHTLLSDVRQHEALVKRLTGVLDTGELTASEQAEAPVYAREYVLALRESGRPTPGEVKRAEQIEADRLRDDAEADEADRERSRNPWRTRFGKSTGM